MARHGFGDPKDPLPRASPHLEEVEEQSGRNEPGPGRALGPSPRRHSLPVRAHPPRTPLVAPRTGGPGRRRDDGSHAGPPQGRLTCGANEDHSPSAHPSLALVFWLTSAINRIVKDRVASTGARGPTPAAHRLFIGPTDTIGRCKLPDGISPRPFDSTPLLA